MLGTRESASCVAKDLTTEQTPALVQERTRLAMCGASVRRTDPDGPLRVCGRNRSLAMSRSLGDFDMKQVGVISEPVVTVHDMSEEDWCVVMASDGIWDVLSSQEAIDICCRHRSDATAACRILIKKAAELWAEQGLNRDDISGEFERNLAHIPLTRVKAFVIFDVRAISHRGLSPCAR